MVRRREMQRSDAWQRGKKEIQGRGRKAATAFSIIPFVTSPFS